MNVGWKGLKMDYESFYESLQYHVNKKGYGGQALICRHTDIPRSYLSRIMKKGRKAGVRTQKKIARFFGYGLEEFIEVGRRITLGEDPERTTDLIKDLPEEHLIQRLTDAVRKEMVTAQLLNQTQLLYENIVENSRQLIARFDGNMDMSFVNQACVEITGLSRRELLHHNWKNFVRENYHDELIDKVERMRETGGSFSMELLGQYNRRWIYLTVTIFPPGIGGKDKGQLVGFDITEEVLTRRKLEESERDLNLIYNGSPDMMASVDAGTGVIQKCNRTMGDKLGYEQDQITNASIFSFCHESNVQEARDIFRDFMKNNEIKDRELVLQKKNGDSLPVLLNVTAMYNAKGKIIASNCVLRDLTERRKLVDRLKFIQHGVEMSYVPTLWIGNKANIIYVNNAVCKLLGYSKEELEEMRVWDINPLITREAWPDKWDWFQAEENVVFAGQYKAKDETIIPVEFQVSNLKYPDGRRYNVVFAKPMVERKSSS